MTRTTELDRRTVLRATGAAVGGVLLAGCTGGDGGDGGDGGSDGGGGDGGSDGGSGDFGGWFGDTDNYDGVVDETGADEVTVTVGAEGNSGNNAFDPAAVRVDAGTTVVWEWTGQGTHNVVADDGSFESELTSEEGHVFEHSFDEAGEYKYVCNPHESLGMRGVVVVE